MNQVIGYTGISRRTKRLLEFHRFLTCHGFFASDETLVSLIILTTAVLNNRLATNATTCHIPDQNHNNGDTNNPVNGTV